MVDKSKCDQMISNLTGYVQELRRLSTVSKEEFLANKDKMGSAKYHFVIAIEACIDIANHIISSERFRIPRDNADSFNVLAENGVIERDRLEACRAMAKFRNRLVHLYWDVADTLVHEYLQDCLPDLEMFASAAASFVNALPDAEADSESNE